MNKPKQTAIKRKYLDDIKQVQSVDWIEDTDSYKSQREIYGFDFREIWNLDDEILMYLYQRLKMFKELGSVKYQVDKAYRFEVNEKQFSFNEAVDYLIERMEFILTGGFKDELSDYKYCNCIKEIFTLLGEIFTGLWI